MSPPMFLCIAVPPRVDCCVVPCTSRIAAPILDRLGRHRFRSQQRLSRRRLIFYSTPPFPSVNPNKKIICIAAPQRGDCCVAVKPNAIVAAPKDGEDSSDLSFSSLLLLLAQRVYCLCRLHELIVVLRNQTGPSSTYSLIIYRGPWPIVMNGNECRRCKTSLPPSPGARGRQHGDCFCS